MNNATVKTLNKEYVDNTKSKLNIGVKFVIFQSSTFLEIAINSVVESFILEIL